MLSSIQVYTLNRKRRFQTQIQHHRSVACCVLISDVAYLLPELAGIQCHVGFRSKVQHCSYVAEQALDTFAVCEILLGDSAHFIPLLTICRNILYQREVNLPMKTPLLVGPSNCKNLTVNDVLRESGGSIYTMEYVDSGSMRRGGSMVGCGFLIICSAVAGGSYH